MVGKWGWKMELIAKKSKNYGEEYQAIHEAIMQIDKDIRTDAAKSKKKKVEVDKETYFVRLKFMGEFIKQMLQINDYEASMHCCKFLMPRIEKFIAYITDQMEFYADKDSQKAKNFYEWIEYEDDLTEYTRRGQKQVCGRFRYIFDVMYWDYMKIAARYSIHWMINYMERDKLKKDYPSRERILASVVHYANSMLLGRIGLKWLDEEVVPTEIIFSTMPSSGKSFVNNVYNLMGSILGALHMSIGGILRVGNEESNILRQSRQTMNMLESNLIIDVYPELAQLVRANGKYDPYSKSSEEEWGVRDVKNDPSTTVFKTRDSAINSVRCYMGGIYDDPSRGQEEANNINKHKEIANKFNGDFKDRFKSQDDMAILLTGTMFNPYDVFSLEIQRAKAKGYYEDKKFANTYITNDKKTVIIVNDCEDEYGRSAYPEFISTETLMDKKEALDPFTYACVWRQRPIPAEGLLFDDTLLMHYEEFPRSPQGLPLLTDYAFAYLDPTRRSNKDFLSMPICKKHTITGQHYLVDAIFGRKSTKDCYDEIIDKIEEHHIIKFVIEENTSADLETVLKEKLKKRGITYCEITTIYNTINKQQRIADLAGTTKSNIVFPKKSKFNPKISQIGNFLHWLGQYSNIDSNNYDDAPDSLCGYTKAFIVDSIKKVNTISAYKNLPY